MPKRFWSNPLWYVQACNTHTTRAPFVASIIVASVSWTIHLRHFPRTFKTREKRGSNYSQTHCTFTMWLCCPAYTNCNNACDQKDPVPLPITSQPSRRARPLQATDCTKNGKESSAAGIGACRPLLSVSAWKVFVVLFSTAPSFMFLWNKTSNHAIWHVCSSQTLTKYRHGHINVHML